MKIALIASNILPISSTVKKGTELFVHLLCTAFARYRPELEITLFASGDSQTPIKLDFLFKQASFLNQKITIKHHKIFELAHLGYALSKQDSFDLYHVHIGNGEVILPFVQFVNKPIVITLHDNLFTSYKDLFFPLFNQYKNVFFVSISNHQRQPLPQLNYIKTIYNGVDLDQYQFSSQNNTNIIAVGRGIPEKGLDIALTVAKNTKKTLKLFIIRKQPYTQWLNENIIAQIPLVKNQVDIHLGFELDHKQLIKHYQQSKLFIFPIRWEEPFGMVMPESMACGTPVVAFARGSVPEVIKDGETGFIVNPSDDDIRGNWIIKKTGIEGLCEAVEKIYSMPEEEYKQMRRACRAHVEKNFTVERMVNEYEKVYQQVINLKC